MYKAAIPKPRGTAAVATANGPAYGCRKTHTAVLATVQLAHPAHAQTLAHGIGRYGLPTEFHFLSCFCLFPPSTLSSPLCPSCPCVLAHADRLQHTFHYSASPELHRIQSRAQLEANKRQRPCSSTPAHPPHHRAPHRAPTRVTNFTLHQPPGVTARQNKARARVVRDAELRRNALARCCLNLITFTRPRLFKVFA